MSLDVNQTLTEKNHAINCNYFNYYTCPSSSRMLLIHYHIIMYLLTVKIQRISKVTKDSILYHHTLI